MSRILTALILSIAAHVIFIANLGLQPVEITPPETMMVKLVENVIQSTPVDTIPDIPEPDPQFEEQINSTEIAQVENVAEPQELSSSPETPTDDISNGFETGLPDVPNGTPIDDPPAEDVTPAESGVGNGSENIPETPAPDLDAIRSEYSALVYNAISPYKHYPLVAHRLGQEGNVVVRFIVDSVGNVSGLEIQESSGFTSIDNAAADAVTNASPVPPIPPELGTDSLTLTLTIIFTLD